MREVANVLSLVFNREAIKKRLYFGHSPKRGGAAGGQPESKSFEVVLFSPRPILTSFFTLNGGGMTRFQKF